MNKLIQTDSYKISHSYFYPQKMNYMFDYVEARKGGKHSYSIFFGLQMFIKDFMLEPFTQEDIDEAEDFYSKHFMSDQVFNKEMFQHILDTYGGYFPVTIKAVPEGTKIPEGNVLCTFECNDPKCASIVSFLETMATSYIWYGTTVATNSYAMKQILQKYADKTTDGFEIDFSLHDFGARGVSPSAQKVGGAAHLINFMGSDTLEGVYAAEKYYGTECKMPAYSIPATEHSVMCSEGRDGEMIVAQRVFDRFAKENGIVAMVNDTYDMEKHIRDFSKIFREKYQKTGVRWVTRPDSGYPPESVVKCLDILFEEFGGTFNSKKLVVLHSSVRVIQGDGIDIEMLEEVLKAVESAGYSTENVAFGSGGGLLQKVNRDDLRFAMKASYIEVDGESRNIYKDPVTQNGDYSKKSKAGRLSLYQDSEGRYLTMTDEERQEKGNWPFKEVLDVVYTCGKVFVETKFLTFDEVRKNSKK